MTTVEYSGVADARAHFKDILDAAMAGTPASIRRDSQQVAVVDAARLRFFLASVAPRAEVVAEAGGWSVFIPGLPIAADGDTFEAAIDEMVDALREYAEDWVSHLRHAPNHVDNWALVQLVALSDDQTLSGWLTGGTPAR